MCLMSWFFFFFKQKTAYEMRISDWSSDVCSSDVYWFGNDGDPELFCASADWLERNLLRRVETGFPILDPAIATRVREEALDNYLSDNLNAWELQPDGSSLEVDQRNSETPPSAQASLPDKICA